MAITTTFVDPPPANYVLLPSHPDRRRVRTGLARRSAAVVDWLVSAHPDELGPIIGEVPKSLMVELQRRLQSLREPPQ